MPNFRLLFIFILLLSSSITTCLNASETDHIAVDSKIESQFSEDLEDLAYSHLSVSKDFLKDRSKEYSTNFKYNENTRKLSRDKAYFSGHRFIQPGLSLPEIIFPFHIFL
jgi:hypothetical protein